MDMSANEAAKKLISNKFNRWYANRVGKHLSNGVALGDVRVPLKLSEFNKHRQQPL